MPLYLARLFYLGTKYYGSQWQPNVITVQGELVKALCKWSGENHTHQTVQLSGRTDRGVHSFGQIVQFHSTKFPRVEQINNFLPDDIKLWAICTAPPNFSPRNSILARHYRYYLDMNQESLNLSSITEACNSLIGSNDYALFSKPDDGRPTFTTILNISLKLEPDCTVIDIVGTSFLWKLVRKIVAVLVRIGLGELRPDIITRLIAGEEALPGGINPAPAESLVLVESIVPFTITPSKIAVGNIRRLLKEKLVFHHRTSTTLCHINDDCRVGPKDWA